MTGMKTETGPGGARRALPALALSMLLASLGVSIANVALPTLARAFASPFQSVQWVILAYLLAVTVMSVAVGRLGDLVGHRRVLLAGLALFTLASAACGLAQGLGVLIAARLVQGLGAATMMAITIALVRETVQGGRTGSAIGLMGTVSAVGTALGPSLGGLLLAGFGWRALFLILVPMGLANMLMLVRALPAQRRPEGSVFRSLDATGMLVLGGTLAAYALSATWRGGASGFWNAGLLALAGLGTGLFIAVERRAASPLIPLSVLRGGGLMGSLALNGLVASVMMATLVVGPFYLTIAFGLKAAMVGLVLSVGPVISALTGVPAGRLVDHLGAGLGMVIGLIAMVGGSFALALVPPLFGLAGYVGAMAVLTPGYQLFQAANTTQAMTGACPDQRGLVSGLLGLSRNLGLLTGASVMGTLFAAATGAADPADAMPGEVTVGMVTVFVTAGALMLVALLLAGHREIGARRQAVRPPCG